MSEIFSVIEEYRTKEETEAEGSKEKNKKQEENISIS